MTSRAGCKVRPWTHAALAELRVVYEDRAQSLDDYCARTGRTRTAVDQQASKYGWRRFTEKWTAEEEAFLAREWTSRNGMRRAELARRLNRSVGCVAEKAFRMGLKRHPAYNRRRATEQALRASAARWGLIYIPEDGWPPHRFRDDAAEAARPFRGKVMPTSAAQFMSFTSSQLGEAA